eukprot:1561606-Pyramimonas_sp.AAC.1
MGGKGMEQLATAMLMEGDWARNTRRAVGSAGNDQLKQMAVATAKTVVGMDVMQDTGKPYDVERKALKEVK